MCIRDRNSLPEYLTVDTLTLDYFKRSLKCVLFARYWHSAWSALGICNDSALYKCTLNNNNIIIIIIISWSHAGQWQVVCYDVPIKMKVSEAIRQILHLTKTQQCALEGMHVYQEYLSKRMDGLLGFNGILSTQLAAISCLRKFKVYS